MKFLCLGYLDMEAFDNERDSVKQEVLRRCFDLCGPFRAAGSVSLEAGLEHVTKTKSIRPRKGRPVVTDGPFTETKEQVGSFFLVDATSIEEAVEIAARHPAAQLGEEYGFGIEVRPVQTGHLD